MASHKFPLSVADKHQILFVKPLPPAELSSWGKTYGAAGQPHDALEFYQAAKDEPALKALTDKAIEDADLVLFLNACRALGVEPPVAQLEALKARAASLGMEGVVKRASTLLAPKS